MLKEKINKNIWAEEIGLIEIALFLFESKKYKLTVYYDQYRVNKFNQSVINFLKSLKLCKNFYAKIFVLNVKDSHESALNYKCQNDLNDSLDLYCDKFLAIEADWFKKMTKSYLALFLWQRFAFITTANELLQKDIAAINEILIKRSPLNNIIHKFYANRNFNLRQSYSISEYIKFTIRPLLLLFNIFISYIFRRKVKKRIDISKPSVWIEYEGSGSIRKTQLSFWKACLKEKSFDVVNFLDREDSPCSKEAIDDIEKHGLSWIDAHNLFQLSALSLKDICGLVIKLISKPKKLPFWLDYFLAQYIILEKIYYSIFRKYNVKILIQHRELSWVQQVQARAIEVSGGIMVGFHWSYFPFSTEPMHLTPQSVYFVWGESSYEWVQKKGNTCRYILPSGLWIMPDDDMPIELESFCKNSDFCIAIFDNATSYSLGLSPENCSVFYLKILKIFKDNPVWRGIIKRKHGDLNDLKDLPNGELIISELKSLMDNNRLMISNYRISPVTVASCVDISVCLGLNSAGIIAGIHGFSAIHWDCWGWSENELCLDTQIEVIYPELDDLEEALIKFEKGEKRIGDFSRWRQKYNHFNDFGAYKRVADFISDFMEEISSSNVDCALKAAVEKYLSCNRLEQFDKALLKDTYNESTFCLAK